MKPSLLWFYGKSGYGKTSAAQYLAEQVRQDDGRVCPYTSEDVLEQLLDACRVRTGTERLIALLATFDFLLLDDLDLILQGKKHTQRAMRDVLLNVAREGTTVCVVTRQAPSSLEGFHFPSDVCIPYEFHAPPLYKKLSLLSCWTQTSTLSRMETVLLAENSQNLFTLRGRFLKQSFVRKSSDSVSKRERTKPFLV
jgi:DnaA protein